MTTSAIEKFTEISKRSLKEFLEIYGVAEFLKDRVKHLTQGQYVKEST